ncbi:MAG: single-stranded DNA-binding protein [Synergistaceae bacterium]|nr:single-stranded DNA-binding protein [Synergistaceae bacterium]
MASRGLNRIQVLGTVVRDPELKHSSSVSYLYFTLASNYQVKNASGGYDDAADFIPFVAFGKTAELISQYCVKGSQIYVEGKARQNKRTDNSGNNIYETQLVASEIRFCGGKRKDSNNNFSSSSGADAGSSFSSSSFDDGNNFASFNPESFPSNPKEALGDGTSSDDDDIPF